MSDVSPSAPLVAPGYIPNADQALLMRAACASTDIARDAWKLWRNGRVLSAVDPVSARVMPWIYFQRDRLQLSAEELSALEPYYRFAWLQNQVLQNSAAEVLGIFREEAIPVMVLKGLPLLQDVFGDEGARYMDDFDLLVKLEDVDRAVVLLKAHGWEVPRPDHLSAAMRNVRHSVEFVHPDGPHCDLHWRLMRPPYPVVDETPVWESKQPFRVRGEPAVKPAPEHLLLQILIHGICWERLPPIRWILDTHLLIKDPRFEWAVFCAEINRRSLGLPVREALEIYEKVLPGELPAEVLRFTSVLRPSRNEIRVFEELTRPYDRAGLRVVWKVYREDLGRAQRLGEVRRGWRGVLEHLHAYLGADSFSALPRQFLRRGLSRIFRAFRKSA